MICYIEVPFKDSDLLYRGALYRQWFAIYRGALAGLTVHVFKTNLKNLFEKFKLTISLIIGLLAKIPGLFLFAHIGLITLYIRRCIYQYDVMQFYMWYWTIFVTDFVSWINLFEAFITNFKVLIKLVDITIPIVSQIEIK